MTAKSIADGLLYLFAAIQDKLSIIPGVPTIIAYFRGLYQDDPIRALLDVCLIFFAVKYFMSKAYKPRSDLIPLTEKEIDDLVLDWEPEPLVSPPSADEIADTQTIPEITGMQNLNMTLSTGEKVQNWSSANFLGLHNQPDVNKVAIDTVKQYGVGTCGPPGFYGTLDIHLKLQDNLARVLGAEAAIIYAQGFAAVAGVIPSFSKRGDIIVADGGVNFSIQRGLVASRSHIHYFKHNDMADLERILNEIDEEHKKNHKKLTRRFIIVEGLYQSTGNIAPLNRLLEIKNKYKYRLILDETYSFGVLGPRGFGITDHFGISNTQVDLIAGGLGTTFGACGGFCAGSINVVDHQVLSNQAYTFSASLPALLTATALHNLLKLEASPSLVTTLRDRVELFKTSFAPIPAGFVLVGAAISPLVHLRYKNASSDERAEQNGLQRIIDEMRKLGYLLTRAKYSGVDERAPIQPAIKICISAGYSPSEVKTFAQTLLKVLSNHQTL